MTSVPVVKLNDGREMPGLALGTWLGFDSEVIKFSFSFSIHDVKKVRPASGLVTINIYSKFIKIQNSSFLLTNITTMRKLDP